MKIYHNNPETNEVLQPIISLMEKFGESEACYYDLEEVFFYLRLEGCTYVCFTRERKSHTITKISAENFAKGIKKGGVMSVAPKYFFGM